MQSGSLPETAFSLFLIVKEYSSWAWKIQSGSLPATVFSLFLIVKEYSSWAGKIQSGSLPATAFSLFLIVKEYSSWAGKIQSGSLPATAFSLFLIVKEYSSWAGKIQSGSLPATVFSLFLIVKEYSSWAGKIQSGSLPVTAFSLFLIVYNTRAMAKHTNLLWWDKARSAQPCRVWEGSYPGYYIYICLVVELLHKLYLVNYVWLLDKNSNAICLFFSSPAPAPRAICIGAPVAHFDRPFESRPVDSVRQEVFRQLAADLCSSSSSGWFTPSGMLLGSLRPLQPCQETSTEAVPRRKAKRQGRSVTAKAQK